MWLFFLFVAVPIVEIALFIQVGGAIGLWPTLGIVVLTAVLGTALMRTQGVQALHRLQRALNEGGDPAVPLVHGALILVAGVLLLTPGFFTDALGIALLIPPLRTTIIRIVGRQMVARSVVFTSTSARGPQPGPGRPPQGADTIEGDYEVVDESAPEDGRDRPSGWSRHQ
ncbi:exclusion protein FxsA [Maritimibacter sp. 55A14]|uniref:FxsA family protein n=1 Tax=Maritimibacter sp. 55A14 TaxID=2174844 RepID=UPI000D619BE9|nr:FxsA family protein [Maritimibacter sp. 55A14]PWE33561.1 exclusion protein FxsA [Maritimibacter sp. 55A14]